ncbi:MAG: hypothetical protein M1833_003995 [Piccolia ochrophora]|nr:MAG: hypothetical protein M1833_003995 [Piccolia ochrophora]
MRAGILVSLAALCAGATGQSVAGNGTAAAKGQNDSPVAYNNNNSGGNCKNCPQVTKILTETRTETKTKTETKAASTVYVECVEGGYGGYEAQDDYGVQNTNPKPKTCKTITKTQSYTATKTATVTYTPPPKTVTEVRVTTTTALSVTTDKTTQDITKTNTQTNTKTDTKTDTLTTTKKPSHGHYDKERILGHLCHFMENNDEVFYDLCPHYIRDNQDYLHND